MVYSGRFFEIHTHIKELESGPLFWWAGKARLDSRSGPTGRERHASPKAHSNLVHFVRVLILRPIDTLETTGRDHKSWWSLAFSARTTGALGVGGLVF